MRYLNICIFYFAKTRWGCTQSARTDRRQKCGPLTPDLSVRTTPAVEKSQPRPAQSFSTLSLSLSFLQNYLTFSKKKVNERVKCLPGVTCYDVTLASPLLSDPKQSQLSSGEHFSGLRQSLCIKLTSWWSPTSSPYFSSLLWRRTPASFWTQKFLRWMLTNLQQLTSYVCLQTKTISRLMAMGYPWHWTKVLVYMDFKVQ